MTTDQDFSAQEWRRIAESRRFIGGDLRARSENGFETCGRIANMTIVGDTITFTFKWVAMRRNPRDKWVWAPELPKTKEISGAWIRLFGHAQRYTFTYGENYALTDPNYLPEYPEGGLKDERPVDETTIMHEYHIEVHVRHHLYPPNPLEELRDAQAVHNVEPPDPSSQGEVKVAAVTFVIQSFSLRAAKSWARAECQRIGLPVIKVVRTQLLPGL